MTNESILSLSDDVKASMRCYAVMAGFLLLGILELCPIIAGGAVSSEIGVVESSIFILLGTTLAFLHKRDLYAMFFILMGFIRIIFCYGNVPVIHLSTGILLIFLAIAFYLTKNEQRIIVSVLLTIQGAISMILYLGLHDAFRIMTAIYGVICIYLAFAAGCERFKLPLRDILLADEENPSNDGTPVHFKVSGTSIVLAVNMFVTLVAILTPLGFGTITGEQRSTMMYALALIDILAGVIMLTAGRMRQTPFIFIIFGANGLIMASTAGTSGIIMATVVVIVLGILILLRSESRILLGLLVLFFGIASIPTLIDPSLTMVKCALEFVPLVLEAYLILALNSDGRLKLF